MNEGIKLSNRELGFINLFETISSVKVKDCIIDDKFNRVLFLVEPSQVGLAIGKGGEKINIFKKISLIDAEVIPYYEELEKMTRSCFMPFEIKGLKVMENNKGEKTLLVYVDFANKAKVIGESGKNVFKTKLILRRYFGIKNVIVV